MARVLTQNKIVSSLFSASIRDRLYEIGDRLDGEMSVSSSPTRGKSIVSADATGALFKNSGLDFYGSKRLADIFLVTVGQQTETR